jgi:hypothetical protein
MKLWCALILATVAAADPACADDELELPPGVTPAIRVACEADVRRLCVGPNPTAEKIKICVIRKYAQLGPDCKAQLASAGLGL